MTRDEAISNLIREVSALLRSESAMKRVYPELESALHELRAMTIIEQTCPQQSDLYIPVKAPGDVGRCVLITMLSPAVDAGLLTMPELATVVGACLIVDSNIQAEDPPLDAFFCNTLHRLVCSAE